MVFEIYITRKIKAKREFVFDWWTDLSPDDAKLVKPLKNRKIISKTAKEVVLQDEEMMYFRKMKFEVRVTLERPERWSAQYVGKAASARSEYLLRPEENGTTTLFYHSVIEPKDFLTNLFSPIVRHFVKRVFSGEMDIFNSTLEAEYQRKTAT